MRCIMISDTPDSNILAMAPPDLIECKPTSSLVNPNLFPPINSTALFILEIAYVELIYLTNPLSLKLHTVVSLLTLGTELFNLLTVVAQATTGHNV